MPPFGAGVVNVPPGAVKRLKNVREVFMIFFVHAGRVWGGDARNGRHPWRPAPPRDNDSQSNPTITANDVG